MFYIQIAVAIAIYAAGYATAWKIEVKEVARLEASIESANQQSPLVPFKNASNLPKLRQRSSLYNLRVSILKALNLLLICLLVWQLLGCSTPNIQPVVVAPCQKLVIPPTIKSMMKQDLTYQPLNFQNDLINLYSPKTPTN